jgi:hypothetical protein
LPKFKGGVYSVFAFMASHTDGTKQ